MSHPNFDRWHAIRSVCQIVAETPVAELALMRSVADSDSDPLTPEFMESTRADVDAWQEFSDRTWDTQHRWQHRYQWLVNRVRMASSEFDSWNAARLRYPLNTSTTYSEAAFQAWWAQNR